MELATVMGGNIDADPKRLQVATGLDEKHGGEVAISNETTI